MNRSRSILEISDCAERIGLWFEIDWKRRRANSLHKLDRLIAALRLFRKGLEEEFAECDRRERDLKKTVSDTVARRRGRLGRYEFGHN